MTAAHWLRVAQNVLATAATLAVMSAASGASAQNYEGDTVVRFGAFGQGTFLNYGIKQPLAGSAGADTVGYGLSAGIDYRPTPYWLMGVELDASMGDARNSFNGVSYGFDYLATIRGRFGVYPHPDWLLYGTAGVAFLGFEAQAPGAGNKAAETTNGLTVGAGIEYNWHHVILFGEYDYAAFGSSQFRLPNGRNEVDADAHLVRLGIKFKVGYDYHGLGEVYEPMK